MDENNSVIITVNGISESTPMETTVAQYISTHNYDEHSLVVELNFKVVIKSLWASTKISTGDNLIIFRYVGGG